MKFSNSMTLQVFHDLYEPCYILSKFKLLNTDTPLVWTLYGPLSVGINGFGCTSHLAGGGGHLGIFWVGMYRLGLQIGTLF